MPIDPITGAVTGVASAIGGAGAAGGSSRPAAPPPPPPPKTSKKPPSTSAAYQTFLKQHPKVKPYSQLIAKWASVYAVDPVYLAALILFESGGNPNARSSADALGLAQIHMPTWAGKQTPWGETITREWATNPQNAVRFAAWYLSQGVKKHGSYDAAYRKGYNPGYTGPGPFATVPKTYAPTGKGLSPEESASVSVETSAARQALTDPWVVVTKKGLRYVKGPEPPKNALLYDSLPLTRSQFLNAKRQLEETWISYTGKRPSDMMVAGFLQRGWSQYTLIKKLTETPDFFKSPIWKSRSADYRAILEDTYGTVGVKDQKQLIRRAIVDNLSGSAFQQILRQRDDYITSNEFKQRTASLLGVHEQIMGTPDKDAMLAVKEAALGGWDLNQYAAWLRSTDAYRFSPEYQSKALSFADALGLITGQQAALKPGVQPPAQGNPKGFGPLPDDPRLKGAGSVAAMNTLGVASGASA